MKSSRQVWALLFLVTSGCDETTSDECIEGASIACACTDGRTGAQICLADGTLGVCECTGGFRDSGVPDSRVRDAGGSDTGVDAATRDSSTDVRSDVGSSEVSVLRTAPSSDSFYTNSSVSFQFTVEPTVVDGVELLVDGAAFADLVPPYSYVLDTTSLSEGAHEVVAQAVASGASGSSIPMTVIVDRTPPRVVAESPTRSSTGVWIPSGVSIQLSESVDPDTLNDAAVTISASSDASLPKALSFGLENDQIDIEFADIPAPTTLSVAVNASITDLAGNPLTADVWSYPIDLWTQIAGPAEVPTPARAEQPRRLAVSSDAGLVCVTWARTMGSTPNQLFVSCSTGSAWDELDGPLNADPERSVTDAALTIDDDGRAVVFWTEFAELHGARWDGGSWERLGTVPVTGLRFRTAIEAAVDSAGNPVVAVWTSDTEIEVHRYAGSFTRMGPVLTVSDASADLNLALDDMDRPWIGVSVDRCSVYRLDGADWTEFGNVAESDFTCVMNDLAVGADARPVVALVRRSLSCSICNPSMTVRRWDGAAWDLIGLASQASGGSIAVRSDLNPVWAYYDNTISRQQYFVRRFESGAWEELGTFESRFSEMVLSETDYPIVQTYILSDLLVFRRSSPN
ncbi:MAG: Ig-like domain-containing protein [Myxococcota bacterium]